MFKNTFQYFDFGYYLRFAALFFLFYLGYTFVIAAAAPTGPYFPFVDQYLNFPLVIRFCVLHIGQFMLSLFGYSTFITEGRITSSDGLNVLEMAWACYGLGLKSFWVAFVCANRMELKHKIYWSLLGVLSIFLLNCLRVMIMMIAMVEKWTIAEYLGTNAHDLFNYLCYAALFGLVLIFFSKAKTNTQNTPVPSLKA